MDAHVASDHPTQLSLLPVLFINASFRVRGVFRFFINGNYHLFLFNAPFLHQPYKNEKMSYYKGHKKVHLLVLHPVSYIG
uniref:Uncharacterized protein n=1 Tax=Anguilla anguilla TaxID=7936 RepID=A0A0E9WI87_ANGAN